jgi:putative acetyltransferase
MPASRPTSPDIARVTRVRLEPSSIQIRVDDLRGAAIIDLLQLHLRSVALHSPPESIHALDLAALRKPDITFWSAWRDDDLLGCGALKALDPGHGEIKSMRTVPRHLRKGVAAVLLGHIIDEATRRRYGRLSLETGSMAAFAPARALYVDFGFVACGPFADYVEDPYSVFMSKGLSNRLDNP